MTNEEAIKHLKTYDEPKKVREAFEMAIKALEQEPCEDVISRSAAIDALDQSINLLEAEDRIRDLPPVKPQPKTGHWEEVGEEYIQVYDLNGIPSCGDERICSECGFETVFIGEHCSQYKFCPNCGARMVEPQERSDKEGAVKHGYKQAIQGFAEFFKGITGNQNLEIPSEIAEKCGIQAQADDDILDTFGDKGKQKVFHISDTDITFAEEINYEEAQRRFGYAMNHIGVVAVRGGI